MKRCVIYQVAVGEQRHLYETCIRSVSDYCQRHSIEHIVQREPMLRIQPMENHRSEQALRLGYLPIFEKANALALIQDHDAVLILDSDIYVRDSAPNIFYLPETAPFAGVIERDMPLTARHKTKVRKYSEAQYGSLRAEANFEWNDHGAAFFNMGMMLLRQSIQPWMRQQTAEQFLRRLEFERFVNGEGAWRWSTDQTLLNYWLRSSNIPVQCLDYRWNALYGAVDPQALREAYFLHFFLADHHVGDRDIQDILTELGE